ncbi:hypothetical protein AcV7_010449 [Taiwanofungus camphoratus]|nr:hypothetical protein AcV7_010449 [Antrodia cinnamomea]
MVLIIPQATTECILGDRLRKRGVTVLRPYKVVDMKRNDQDAHITDVFFEDGSIIHARCVIGADGAKSTVRRTAGVSFDDPDRAVTSSSGLFSQAVIADVTFTTPLSLPDSGLIFVLSRDNGFLIAALPPKRPEGTSEQLYRIAVGIPWSLGTPPHAPSTSYIQTLVDAWGPRRIKSSSVDAVTALPTISQTHWATRFRIHSAIADTFFTHVPSENMPSGVILLVGDAAHIHPPLGGQGMNLGLRDAMALGPALAAYLKGVSSMESLDNAEIPLRLWATARRERALTIIRMTKRLFDVMTLPDRTTWLFGIIPVRLARVRNVLLRVFTKFRWVRMMVAWKLSGLGY